MKLLNNSKCALLHGEFKLPIGGVLDVPEKIAKIWLAYKGVVQHMTDEDIKEATQKAVQDALKKAAKETVKKAVNKVAAKKNTKKAGK